MKDIKKVELLSGSREENLPDFVSEFPYIASRVQLDYNVPWHWHRGLELFYVKSGSLEYSTPQGKWMFHTGSGGIVNSGVLHATKSLTGGKPAQQFIHIFDPELIAGQQGGRIERKYVTPVTSATWVEMIPLHPQREEQAEILELIRKSFELRKEEFGYEIRLREMLSNIWLQIFDISQELLVETVAVNKSSDKLKIMMAYIHEHYAGKILVSELAQVAYVSERECFRAFRDCLHQTPIEYIRSYRLQMACQRLATGHESLTGISHSCGLGSSSYFAKVFKDEFDCSPMEYRRRWQNSDRKWQK